MRDIVRVSKSGIHLLGWCSSLNPSLRRVALRATVHGPTSPPSTGILPLLSFLQNVDVVENIAVGEPVGVCIGHSSFRR